MSSTRVCSQCGSWTTLQSGKCAFCQDQFRYKDEEHIRYLKNREADSEKFWQAMLIFAEKLSPGTTSSDSFEQYLKTVMERAEALLTAWKLKYGK